MSATWIKTCTHVDTGEPYEHEVTFTLGLFKVNRSEKVHGTRIGTTQVYPSLLPPLKARRLARRLEADGFKRAT